MDIVEFLKEKGKINVERVKFKDSEKTVYILKLSQEIYDKDLIFSSAYYVIDDDCAVYVDKNENEWVVYFFGNENKLKDFLNYIINYYFYRENSKESLKIKEELIKLFLYGGRKEWLFFTVKHYFCKESFQLNQFITSFCQSKLYFSTVIN